MKRRFLLTICCCITVSLFVTVAAQASTVNFDFTGIPFRNTSAGSSFSFNNAASGLTLTVSAKSGSDDSWVNWSPLGLGVTSLPSLPSSLPWWLLDDPQIDGVGRDDLLLLRFDEDVTINSATFTLVGGNDEFRLFIDDAPLPFVSGDIPGDGVYSFTGDTSNRTGRIFGFTVTECNDDYMLAGVTVEISNVPIPTAGLLFVSSAAGFLAVRKKGRYKN